MSEVNTPLVSGSGATADTSGINDNINNSLMDIDNDDKAVSASSGKHKFSTSTPFGAFSFAEPAMYEEHYIIIYWLIPILS